MADRTPDPRDRDPDDAEPAEPEVPAVRDPIFDIPGGAKLGTCWHEIFELADFTAAPAAIAQVVDDTLDRHRICPQPAGDLPEETQRAMAQRRQAVHGMVARVLATPLDAGHGAFALQDVPLAQRRSELEFQFSLRDAPDRRIGQLADLLRRQWHSNGRNESFLDGLGDKMARIPRGFMTGFIDLVFLHQDRFYVVDWKSNQLNRDPLDFGAKGLAAEMERNSYYLQYLIYSVAVHGFLARHLAEYDFDRHFGGVFYLFLRGMDGRSQRGVFADRPSKPLIESLSDFFAGGAP